VADASSARAKLNKLMALFEASQTLLDRTSRALTEASVRVRDSQAAAEHSRSVLNKSRKRLAKP
jgi:hypothetical protein